MDRKAISDTKTSKGEELISAILKSNNILFEREKTFNDLKHGLLRFDFYLPERNIIIEWDGLQHFEQVSYFQKTRKDFLKGQENDRRKNNYCLTNNIVLYRIPYWEQSNIKKIEDIFQSKFIVTSMWHNDKIKKDN